MYDRCVREVCRDGWCPLARRDVLAIVHANLSETCRQLDNHAAALRHAVIALGQSPHWERGCVRSAPCAAALQRDATPQLHAAGANSRGLWGRWRRHRHARRGSQVWRVLR